MKKRHVVLLAISFVIIAFACARVPISNRRQVNLINETEMIGMSMTAYQEFLDTNKVLGAKDPKTVMVRGIGDRIKTSVEKYLADNGQSQRVEGFAWEFNVVDQDVVNAWCMPGGKVVVYTGILPVTQDEKSLAVVMGHEIAHAIARHGNERMSNGLIAQFGMSVLATAMDQKPAITKNIFLQSYGIGSTLGMLGYSRNHETEADKLGLVFMAMAGYDPQSAIGFWERMAQSGGQKPPEILSTHPSDETRIATLKEFMPEAMKYYTPAPAQN
ncbi:MAG: M48 family metallopeptidase [Flavobacteriales bacterium]